MGVVYVVTNKVNGMQYVGKTVVRLLELQGAWLFRLPGGRIPYGVWRFALRILRLG